MLEHERQLAQHLQILMHDWPKEAKTDLIELVTTALKEQRQDEREYCARIAESIGDEQDDGSQAQYVAYKIAHDIRARNSSSK